MFWRRQAELYQGEKKSRDMSVLQLLFCHLVIGHSLVGLSGANFW